MHNNFVTCITFKSFCLFQCIWHPLEPLKSLYMVTGPYRTQKNTRLFFVYLCFLSCDHIQWFHWLQFVIHHGYLTFDGCHIHWNKQKELKVMLEPKRSCTILPAPHCIKQLDKHPARSGSAPEVDNFWHRHTYVALVCWQWVWISISYWRLHLLLLLLVGGVVNWKAPDNDSLHTFSYIIYLIEMN